MLIELDSQHLDACREIYKTSVYAVDSQQYSSLQKQVWAKFHSSDEFAEFVLKDIAVGVTDSVSRLLGFCSADLKGHIKGLYVHPKAQRKGYASKMLNDVMHRLEPIELLTVDASKASLPVFLKFGFSVVKEERVEREGIQIPRFKMACRKK